MPLSTPTNLTADGSGTNATSYATASISPAVGLVLVGVCSSIGSGTPTVPTLSGLSGTWTEILTCHFDQTGTQYRLTAFRCTNHTGSGAVTIDFAGVTQASCTWTFSHFAGANTSSPVVQSEKSAEPGSSASSISQSLAGAITAGNGAWMCAGYEVQEAGSAEGGWTGLGDGDCAGPATHVFDMGTTSASDNSGTISWTTSAGNGAIIVEVAAAPSGSLVYPKPHTRMQALIVR